ncbi:MAG: hypothetical protein MUO77_11720, partial [Anaerolineales bacterium]|nr:hypothetical protein [Anaerolineales bacterium]
MISKKIVAFLIFLLFSGLACKGSFDFGFSEEPTLPPTLTSTPTLAPTFAPSPTVTPTPRFRVIPEDY